MAERFDLIIDADHPSRTAVLRLRDGNGQPLAGEHRVDFSAIPAGQAQGLFDLRNYLRLYVADDAAPAAVARLGVLIAERILGQDIFEPLWRPESRRTLRIQLPGAAQEDNPLAAALARVPWEIARPGPEAATLGERNLLVRVVHDTARPASAPLALAPDEDLRVLFVFAEARGSLPLGSRRERRALLRLFEREVYPRRRVVAHWLGHGVTRARLQAQVREHGGYHLVHWSGHGHLNRLELARPDGSADHLSGRQLLDLFHDAGGLLPRLVVLSACHSGDILRVRDWEDFLAIAAGKAPKPEPPPAGTSDRQGTGPTPVPLRDLDLSEQPGYTGTAHALLQGGVPAVVAMRYAVGDDYARELGLALYRALLADAMPKDAAAALTLARRALLNNTGPDTPGQDGGASHPARFAVCDHATPVLYGEADPGLRLADGRSPALNPPDPRLTPIAELNIAEHAHFVGRTWELAGLGAAFIGAGSGAEVQPIAVVTGLGGMGKTALVAEALDLWRGGFQWVLEHQAKGGPLVLETWLRDIHLRLTGELGRYHDHVKARPADAIYRDPGEGFDGPGRLERLLRNLVRALRDEPILLVLDNFETNLADAPSPAEPASAPAPAAAWPCREPGWDRCLATLARELPGGPSRVLITTRRPVAALTGAAACQVRLGPLPAPEAALFLREHPVLSAMVFGADKAEQELAERLLGASRFHPLLMDRLARLAGDPVLRPRLLEALDALEGTAGFERLPDLFAAGAGDRDATELAYLADALAGSIDRLLAGLPADARRLLWVIALANQPEAAGLVQAVWSKGDPQQAQLRQIQKLLEALPTLPAEVQAQLRDKLRDMPSELRALIDALPPEPDPPPDPTPLLDRLLSLGLVTPQSTRADDPNPDLACHELVRERVRAWMQAHPADLGCLAEDGVRLAYAGHLAAAYEQLQHRDMSSALAAGARALVYCVQARAWDRLGDFASVVVTGSRDPRFLEALVPHLKAAAEQAPEGQPRWRCLGLLADALRQAGRPDAALPFYGQTAAQARAAAEAGGDTAGQAWSDLGWISGNWAAALVMTRDLDAARQRQLEAAAAKRNGGRPEIGILGSELEALRIDIMQGKAEAALPEVEARLARVQGWWDDHRRGRPVPEAPEPEVLARALISALDIARQADYARQDWASALGRLDASLAIKQALQRPAEDLGVDRLNRANVLMQLPGRLGEAKAELEDCLELFAGNPAMQAKARSSLANVFHRQGDPAQAMAQQRRALALRDQLPDPADRALSHNNLALYLEASGTTAALAEAPGHLLADLAYCLAAGLGQSLQTSFRNYVNVFRRARAAGTGPDIPRLAALLADPGFAALAPWLRQRRIDPAALQADIDAFLDQAREAASDAAD